MRGAKRNVVVRFRPHEMYTVSFTQRLIFGIIIYDMTVSIGSRKYSIPFCSPSDREHEKVHLVNTILSMRDRIVAVSSMGRIYVPKCNLIRQYVVEVNNKWYLKLEYPLGQYTLPVADRYEGLAEKERLAKLLC